VIPVETPVLLPLGGGPVRWAPKFGEGKSLLQPWRGSLEEIYEGDPSTGYRRMRAVIERERGVKVNHKRIRRLMRIMGLKGIAPVPKTTKTTATDCSNLLKGFNVTRPNQVWCADITYIGVRGGFAYGVSIMDLCSRKVLSFEISNTMDEGMCVEAARKALERYSAPRVIHTDRGKQFMGRRFRNSMRPHQSLGYKTPDEVYYGGVCEGVAA
jgi:putative transposase